MTQVNRPLLSSRLAGMGTTIFAEMSELAVATGSINLGQGFPEPDGPREIAAAAAEAIMEGRGNQYPPGAGIPELRQAVAAHQNRFYGLDLDPDTQVLITVGASEGISASLLALVEPGDEVLVFEPYYDCYPACIAMAGGVRVPLPLRQPGFRPDLDAMADAITPRTRCIVLNTPHNPTGTVFTRDELAQIAVLACEHDLLVITDDAYEHIVFEGEHVPIMAMPGMSERTVTIGSAGKTFSFTGWRVGWVTAAPELVAAVRTAKQYLTFVGSGPFQYAVAQGLALPNAYYDSVSTSYRARRDLFCDGLAEVGFEVFRPAGAYFVTTDVRPLGYGDGVEFCRDLPSRAGVVAIPNSAFHYDHPEIARSQVRFSFCKRQEVLTDVLSRLAVLRQRAAGSARPR